MDRERIARDFMLTGIQEWGQSKGDRAKATKSYLESAGFNVEQSGYPIFGGMFPKQPITGPDGEAAHQWLHETLRGLKRGEFNSECRQLQEAAEKRAAAAVG